MVSYYLQKSDRKDYNELAITLLLPCRKRIHQHSDDPGKLDEGEVME